MKSRATKDDLHMRTIPTVFALSLLLAGCSVFSGMIASTCLAVLFVPCFFVLLQRFEEWRKSKKKPPAATTAEPSPQAG